MEQSIGFKHIPLYDPDTLKVLECIVPDCKGKRFSTIDLDDRYGTVCDECGYVQMTYCLKTKLGERWDTDGFSY